MYRTPYLAALVAVTLLGALSASADALSDAQNTIREAWNKVQSVSAKATVAATVPTGENRLRLTGEGTVEYLKEGTAGKYRQEIKIVLTDPQPLEMTTTMIFDGQDLYMTNTVGGTTTTVKDAAGSDPLSPPPGGAPMLDTLEQVATLSLESSETVDGKTHYILAGVPKDAANAAFSRVVLHVDAETGLRVKTEFYESKDVLTASVVLSDIVLDAGVDAARFAAPASTAKITVNPPAATTTATPGTATP